MLSRRRQAERVRKEQSRARAGQAGSVMVCRRQCCTNLARLEGKAAHRAALKWVRDLQELRATISSSEAEAVSVTRVSPRHRDARVSSEKEVTPAAPERRSEVRALA